jgi:hypothetical protein
MLGMKYKKGSVINMGDLSAERTPLVIAAEINMIKYQTEKWC